MKRLIRWVAALAVLEGGALFGQGLIGTWQGPLQVSQTQETPCASCSKSRRPLREPSTAKCIASIRAARMRRRTSR